LPTFDPTNRLPDLPGKSFSERHNFRSYRILEFGPYMARVKVFSAKTSLMRSNTRLRPGRTGNCGDGKTFVTDVLKTIHMRTAEGEAMAI
jgi:hypothetical protein